MQFAQADQAGVGQLGTTVIAGHKCADSSGLLRQQRHDLERTQFRALGWSLRYRRKLVGAADYALAILVMSCVACLCAMPLVVAWRVLAWLF